MKVLAQLAAIPALRTVERRGNYGVDPGAVADHKTMIRFVSHIVTAAQPDLQTWHDQKDRR